jgi:NAD(P)-dependent dehydrogenase (short-subunit alcohol dehydrogenase family)
MRRLEGKVAVITAAGSGMGRASARLMAGEGAKVVVADINPAGGQETVDLIKKAGGTAMFVPVDVANVADLQKMIAVTVETYGQLNILYNHAGTPGPAGIEGVDVATWDREIAISLRSGFFATQAAIPHMRKVGGGSILFTASVSGLTGSPASPVYSASKGGQVVMVKALAIALAQDNIRVNAICPGGVMTPMVWEFTVRQMKNRPASAGPLTEQEIREFRKTSCPMGRPGEPEEIAWAAVFLASDEASYITGIALPVDGGYSAK